MFFNSTMSQDQPFNQQSFLDQVSVLLKGFRKILKTVQDIAREMASDDDYTLRFKQLLVAATQLQQPTMAVDFVLPTSNEVQSIFLRFVNRLSEHIFNVSKPSFSYNGSQLIDKLLNKLQSCVKTVKNARNIGVFFSNIFSILKQFTFVAERIYYAQPMPEDGIFFEKNNPIAQTNLSSNQQQALPLPQPPPKQSQFQKVMIVLNNYYSGLSCLDLDFQTFKSFYFQTRTQTQEQLVEQMVQRNGIITKALTHYNKRFQEYQRKKQKNQLRKIKIISLQDYQPSQCIKQKRSILSIEKRRQTEKNGTIQEQPIRIEALKTKRKNPQKAQEKQQQVKQQIKEADNQSGNKKKPSYHIKNVYLTFRKPIRAQKESYFNNLSQLPTVCKPIDLSKTIEQNQIQKKYTTHKQKHLKLSPVKLNSFAQPTMRANSFAQPTMRDYLLQQIQVHKVTMIGIGRPVGVIHKLSKQKNKEIQNRPIRASSFARKLSKQFRFKGQDRIFKTLEKPSPLLNNDITI